MKPVFMTYTKKDLINLAVCMFLSVLVIPTFITTEYWYTSILIPWLCLALATIGPVSYTHLTLPTNREV